MLYFSVVLSILSPIVSETISYSIRRKNNIFYQNKSEKIYVLFPSKTKVKVENMSSCGIILEESSGLLRFLDRLSGQ